MSELKDYEASLRRTDRELFHQVIATVLDRRLKWAVSGVGGEDPIKHFCKTLNVIQGHLLQYLEFVKEKGEIDEEEQS